ncbi:hypothetical protein ACWFQ8_14670 [Streptomyces sp. NPDC055254]
MDQVLTAVAALATDYPLGRLRPWRCLGDWAADQVPFTRSRVQERTGRHVVVLAHAVTAPRASWRMLRAGHRDTGAGAPTRSGLDRPDLLLDDLEYAWGPPTRLSR